MDAFESEWRNSDEPASFLLAWARLSRLPKRDRRAARIESIHHPSDLELATLESIHEIPIKTGEGFHSMSKPFCYCDGCDDLFPKDQLHTIPEPDGTEYWLCQKCMKDTGDVFDQLQETIRDGIYTD